MANETLDQILQEIMSQKDFSESFSDPKKMFEKESADVGSIKDVYGSLIPLVEQLSAGQQKYLKTLNMGVGENKNIFKEIASQKKALGEKEKIYGNIVLYQKTVLKLSKDLNISYEEAAKLQNRFYEELEKRSDKLSKKQIENIKQMREIGSKMPPALVASSLTPKPEEPEKAKTRDEMRTDLISKIMRERDIKGKKSELYHEAQKTINLNDTLLGRKSFASGYVGDALVKSTTFQKVANADQYLPPALMKKLGENVRNLVQTKQTELDLEKATLERMKKLRDEKKKESGGQEDPNMNFDIWKQEEKVASAKTSNIITGVFGAIAVSFTSIKNIGLKGVENIGKSLNAMTTNIEGQFQVLGKAGIDLVSKVAPNVGSAMGSFLEPLVKAVMWSAKKEISYKIAQQREFAQGAAFENRGGPVAAMQKYAASALTIQEANAWGETIANAGVVQDSLNKKMIIGKAGVDSFSTGFLTLGKNMKLSAEEMGSVLSKTLVSFNTGEEALKNIQDSFNLLRTAAKNSGIPMQMLLKQFQEVALSARFLNVDYRQMLNLTKQLAEEEKNLGKFGVTRQDFGKISQELTGGAKNITDAMHAYLGMQSGAKDTMQGWAMSRFGNNAKMRWNDQTQSMEMDQVGDLKNTMMTNNIKAMKNLMLKSFTTEDTAETRMFKAKEVGKLAGWSEETSIKVLQTPLEKMEELMKDDSVLDEMRSEKDILAKMHSLEAMEEKSMQGMVKATIGIFGVIVNLPAFLINLFDSNKRKQVAGVISKNFDLMQEGSKETFKTLGEVLGNSGIKNTLKGYEEFSKTNQKLLKEGTESKHSGGYLLPHIRTAHGGADIATQGGVAIGKLQFGEQISKLSSDEYLFASKSAMEVRRSGESKRSDSISKQGDTTQIVINISAVKPDADSIIDIITDKLRANLY